MPPAAKHNDCAIVFDQNCSLEFFIRAKQCLLDIYGSKWLSSSKDSVCLFPFNGQPTEHPDFYAYEPLKAKNLIRNREKNDGRILKVLLEATKKLERRHYNEATRKGLVTLQLVCISEFTGCTFEDEAEFGQIVERLNKIRAFLYVFGPEVRTTHTINNWKDVEEQMHHPVFEQDETPNLKMVKRLVEAVDRSLACGLRLACDLFDFYRNYGGAQANLIPLKAGNRFTFSNRDRRCLRKLSYVRFRSLMDQRKYVLKEDNNIEVDFGDIVNAISACGKIITMSREEREALRKKGERRFDILGFVARSSVDECYYCGDGTHKITPGGLQGVWTKALATVLREKDMVAICAKRVIRNTRAKILVLTPSEDGSFFYMTQLVYGNSVLKRSRPGKLEDYLTAEQDNVICKYLDSLQLELPMNITMTHHPNFKRWWRFGIQYLADEEPEITPGECIRAKAPRGDLLDDYWPERDDM